jgi:hypothetical protein
VVVVTVSCNSRWWCGWLAAELVRARVRTAAGPGLRELARTTDLRLQKWVMSLCALLALRSDSFELLAPLDILGEPAAPV